MLAASEIAIGTALLVPVVPNAVAGAALTGFSGSLLAMYARTPAHAQAGQHLAEPHWLAVSKDVWMLGIGLGLVADGLTSTGSERGRMTSQALPH